MSSTPLTCSKPKQGSTSSSFSCSSPRLLAVRCLVTFGILNIFFAKLVGLPSTWFFNLLPETSSNARSGSLHNPLLFTIALLSQALAHTTPILYLVLVIHNTWSLEVTKLLEPCLYWGLSYKYDSMKNIKKKGSYHLRGVLWRGENFLPFIMLGWICHGRTWGKTDN